MDVNSIASIDFFTKDHSNGAYRSFTKYALLDQPRYYFPNLAADPETGELYAWDGGDYALHVTADAEDDVLTDYVQQNLQYVSSDPSVVSVDQYGRLHVNAEGDAVITASFGQSSVSINVHVGSGGASGT